MNQSQLKTRKVQSDESIEMDCLFGNMAQPFNNRATEWYLQKVFVELKCFHRTFCRYHKCTSIIIFNSY